MTPMTVKLNKDKSYSVQIDIGAKDDAVAATFAVRLRPRTEKTGYTRPVKQHYLKPLEQIEQEALEAIRRFCEDLVRK